MKNVVFLILCLGITSCAHKKIANITAEEKKVEAQAVTLALPSISFEVKDGILHPESVIYSAKHKAIFLSNIANGNAVETEKVSYISKLAPSGKMLKAKWVTGFRAPKGMAIVKDYLYVADIDRLVKIDIKKAKILKTWELPTAKFLNDVVADKFGNIYVSDMFENTIYKLDNDGIKIWLKSSKLAGPNGLFTDGNQHLLVCLWGEKLNPQNFVTETPGGVISIDLKKPQDDFVIEPSVRGYLDGITADNDGNLWISDWMSGDVYKMNKNGVGMKKFNLGQGTADIFYARELGLLLVPQMNQNKLIAIKL
ncbi:MAG: SMP-30/gluconolactonase/LRE family protein [Bacteriovoracaceae bacterium]